MQCLIAMLVGVSFGIMQELDFSFIANAFGCSLSAVFCYSIDGLVCLNKCLLRTCALAPTWSGIKVLAVTMALLAIGVLSMYIAVLFLTCLFVSFAWVAWLLHGKLPAFSTCLAVALLSSGSTYIAMCAYGTDLISSRDAHLEFQVSYEFACDSTMVIRSSLKKLLMINLKEL